MSQVRRYICEGVGDTDEVNGLVQETAKFYRLFEQAKSAPAKTIAEPRLEIIIDTHNHYHPPRHSNVGSGSLERPWPDAAPDERPL